jgi:hypothetical protein
MFYGKILAKHLTEIESLGELHPRYLYASDLILFLYSFILTHQFQFIGVNDSVFHNASLSNKDTER